MRLKLVLLGLLLSSLTAAAQLNLDDIRELWTSGLRDSAFSELSEASQSARADSNAPELAKLFLLEGSYLAAVGDHRLGEQVLSEAESLALALCDSTLLISSVRWLSVVIGSQGRSDEARQLYHRLSDLALALGDKRHEGWAHVGLAWDAWKQGDTSAAANHYTMAAESFSGTDDVEGELWSRNGLASVQTNRGEYEAALDSYGASLVRAREAGLRMAEAIALNGLGSLEYPLGQADQALVHFQQAAEIHAERGHRREKIPALLNIAMCLNSLGRTREAQATLEGARTTCLDGGYADLEATILVKLAETMAIQGRHNAAIEYYQEAIERGDVLRQASRINAHIGLSESLKKLGRYEDALSELSSAKELFENADQNWNGLRVLGKQALIKKRLGLHQEALDLFLDNAEKAKRAGILEFQFHSLAECGECYEALGMPDSALSTYMEAARVWESERRLLLDPEWRERRGSTGRRIFSDLANLMISQGESAEAFDRLQAYKGRTLLERMLGPGSRYNEHLSQSEVSSTTLIELQSSILNEDELFLDFYLGPKRLLLFAITQDDVIARHVVAGDELEARLLAYRQLLSSSASVDVASITEAGSHLFKMLFGESGVILGKQQKIIVSSDGVLNLFPFQELPGAEDRYWTRTPSAAILSRIRRAESSSSDDLKLLALSSKLGGQGAELEGALREVDALEHSFHHVTQMRLDDSPGESESVELTGYDILHIAAHTENDDQSPWQSSIRFSSENELRAADVAELQLDAQLAVLSSCTSAGGAYLSGEGLLGLSSAFLSAGVPTVLATLWAVDDMATAHFVEHFYDALAAGETCNVALASAQEALKIQAETQHPYYWAGFVLIGEGEGRHPLVRRSTWLLWLMGLSLVLILFSVGRLRRNKIV